MAKEKSARQEKLFYERKNGYEIIDEKEKKAMESYCQDYMRFLNGARTEREAVRDGIALAEKKGFKPYTAGMALKAGDKVYYSNRGKSLLLAVIGKQSLAEGATIVRVGTAIYGARDYSKKA